MSRDNKLKGQEGEELALIYLRNKGYQIIAQNYSCRYGEIDIITAKDGLIIFVEVKARSKDIAAAFSSVSVRKRLRLIRTALDFLRRYPEFNDYCLRFDVIGIIRSNIGRKSYIEHIADAFRVEELEDYL